MSAAITDDGIEQMVKLVESAEILAAALDLPVSKAMRMMLKSAQVLSRESTPNVAGLAEAVVKAKIQ